MKPLKYLVTSSAACVCFGLGSQASALLHHDTHELGFVNFGIPSGDADRTLYVNHLIDQALGTTEQADGQTYTRSNNNFGPLTDAVFARNGTSTTINIATGYQYLFAKYDGPNYGSEVWYIGDLSAVSRFRQRLAGMASPVGRSSMKVATKSQTVGQRRSSSVRR